VQPENLAHVRERALALGNKLHGGQRGGTAQLGKPQIGLLLVADPQHGAKIAGQVNEMMAASHAGARILGLVAEDPAGAEQLSGRRRGRVDKSLLVRSVRKVVSDLHQNFRGELSPSGNSTTGQHPVLPPQQQAPGGGMPPGVPAGGPAPVPPQYAATPPGGQPVTGAPQPAGPWHPQPAQPQPQHGTQQSADPSQSGQQYYGQQSQPGAPGAVR
jgi:hypothetical protein